MDNNIIFSKEILEALPLVKNVEIGMGVVANETSDFGGLEGTLSSIRFGAERETDNEGILEIIVDFNEHDYMNLSISNPNVHVSNLEQAIMNEEMLGFKFKNSSTVQTLDGRIVCQSCFASLDCVTETQFEDISWSLVDGVWKKSVSEDSEGKRCPQCENSLEIEEAILPY